MADDRKAVNFAELGGDGVGKFKQGLLQGAQELADVFKIRRLIMQMQKNEPVTMEELMCIHRYICIETMIPTMPFWQLMSRADQLEACKKLKLQKAGIRGMDMTIAMNSLQSSINIMLKGQAFVSVQGSKQDVCVSTNGVWGNVIVGSHMLDYLAKKNAGLRMWELDDNKTKLQFIMDEGIIYRVFLNPRSEYLSLAHVDLRITMASIQETFEQNEILEEMGLGFLNENTRRRRRGSSKRRGESLTSTAPDSARNSIASCLDISEGRRISGRPGSASGRPSSAGRETPPASPKAAMSVETIFSHAGRRPSFHRTRGVHRFGRGAVLMHQGETGVQEVMVITKGTCRVVVDVSSNLPAGLAQSRAMTSSSQSRSYHALTPVLIEDSGFETRVDLRTVALLEVKALIGDVPICLEIPQPAFIITETEVTVLVFPKEEVKEGLELRPLLYAAFRRAALEKIQLVQRRLQALKDGLLIEENVEALKELRDKDDLFVQLSKCKRIGDIFRLVDKELISLPALDRSIL